MIGMMYLVLTAMLALNISKEILNAFVLVDETLVTSTKNTMMTIESDYSHLKKQEIILGEAKVRDALASAEKLRNASDEMVQYIEKLKSELLKESDKSDLNPDGKPKEANDVKSKDNYSKPTNFFINQGNAVKLKNEVLKYREFLLSLVHEGNKEAYKTAIGLNVDDNFLNKDKKLEPWEIHSFQGTILIASVTILNKMVGEVRNAEALILKQIIANIGAQDFKFDKIEGRAIPNSRMVFSGDNYEADIIVAAYDSKSDPEVFYKMGIDTLRDADITSANKLTGEKGVVKLKIAAGGNLGEQKYAGVIRVKGPDGIAKSYGFKDKYAVIKPSATVAADKMNVLYSGIDNPLSISAPVDPTKLTLSMPGCNVTSAGAGKYSVAVPANLIGKTVTATVNASLDGKSQVMGATEFRVKSVPSPRPSIGGGIYGGKRTKADITANSFLTASMGEDFVYDLKWNITSFKVIFVVRNMEEAPVVISGNRFSDELIKKINAATSGTVISFTDIKAKSSAGERVLPEVTVRIR
jgi:gliding motility-associated protein GldM